MLTDANGTLTIPCDRIFNLRDCGGYAVKGGGRLVRGRLFRSAQHSGATAADLDKIAAIGLTAVIDLRGRSERTSAPCPRPEGFDATVISIDDETFDPTALAARRAEALHGTQTAAEAAQAMCATYADMPFRPVLTQLYTRYFAMLAEAEGPVLIHCMAGKDRTGIAVALLHHIAGVHRDDLLADYLLTNSAPGREAWITRVSVHVREHYGNLGDEALRVLFSVDETFLDSAFAAIHDHYGSVDLYLEQALSVDAPLREAIQARLVA